MSSQKRIKLLSKDEIECLYGIPELSNEDREVLFGLLETDYQAINEITNDVAKIDYILQLGYFRAQKYFFKFTFQQIRQDVWFIINNYFPDVPFPKKQVSKHYHYDNQKKILAQFKFKPFTPKEHTELKRYAKKLAKRHIYPRFIFDELISFCHQCNYIRPAYSTMQSIVSDALQRERNRVLSKMSSCLNKSARLALDALLESDDSLYRITLLKKDPKDFTTGEMRKELVKQKILMDVYKQTESVIPQLNISSKNIEYYADMAKFYPTVKLKRFGKNLARLYLLCYVHQRLLKVNDHLTTFFIYRARKYYKVAEKYAEEQLRLDDEQANERTTKAGKLIDLYSDEHISDGNLRSTAFQIVPREQIKQFVKDLIADDAKKSRFVWKYLEEHRRAIAINLRPVFQMKELAI